MLLNPSVQARSGDEYVMAHWSVEQGLPQHTVKEILQTRDGYLWVGTFNGLARFDGVRFTTFNLANTPAMRSEDILALCEDRDGRLWIGAEHGLLCYENGRFMTCPEADAFRDARVMNIQELPDGTLFVATDQGLFRRTDGKFVEISVPNASWPSRRGFLAIDPAGVLWASHRSELYVWEAGRLQWRASLPEEIGILFIDRSGTVWCALENRKIFKITQGVTSEFDHFLEFKKEHFYQARNGDLWISTLQGALRERDGAPLHITKKDGLPGDMVKVAYEDREGNLWLGMSGDGLVRIRSKRLETYSTRDGLSSDDAIAILEDRAGRIWLGTFEGGLNLFENGRWRPVEAPGLPPEVRHVISLCQTRDGALWFGSYGRGAFRWQAGADVERFLYAKENVVRVIFEDREGGLWFGSNKFGVDYIKGESTQRFDTGNGLSLNFITAITQDGAGAIWVGTEDGLNRIANGQVTRFFKEAGIGVNLISTLFTDQEGTLWIGTMGGGLSRYKGGRFARVTTVDGLSHNVVTQIIEDDDGNLWMGSRLGIFRARKKNLNDVMDGAAAAVYCVAYTKADGLIKLSHVGGFQPTSMKTKDGCLWFCGSAGVVMIDPKRMIGNQAAPPVYIEKLLIDGENIFDSTTRTPDSRPGLRPTGQSDPAPTDRPSEKGTQPLKIQAGARRIEFHYTGLDFSAPEQVQFRCKLEGYDEEWQYVGPRRTAYYTRVPPGQYRFRVSTAPSEAGENHPEADLALLVLPSLRETWWFRPSLFLLGVVLLFSLYRLRMRHLRDVEQLRGRIANDLHDEVGSNLGNIALLAHLGRGVQPEGGPRAEFTEIGQVAVETAQAVRDLVWFISPESDTLQDLIQQMEAVAGRSVPAVTVDFQSEVKTPARRVSLSFRRNVFFFFKEALHNALKHARARRVEIRVREQAGRLDLSVQDDGVGYDPASIKPGHGLNSLRLRATELGGTLDLKSRPGAGTQIHLRARLH
jgi:ligand-binding sensor domain-containing protein